MNNFKFYMSRAGYVLSSKLWRYAIVLLVLTFLSTTAFSQKTPPDPGQGATAAGFEVDANFKSGIVPSWWFVGTNYTIIPPTASKFGDDWSKGPAGNGVLKSTTAGVSEPGRSLDGRSIWQVDGNWGNNSAVAEKFSFSGNSNKNGDNIAPGQSPYSIQAGGSGPQKNDITNTYLHSREVNGKTWLFFGAETRATNGNSYLDFEYNQYGVSTVGNQLVGKADSTSGSTVIRKNGRAVNDFLLVINYTGGGNRPIVGIRKWLPSGTWSEELPVGELGAFVTTNIDTISPVAPNMAFAGDGAHANVVMALQFVEGGINISDVEGLEDLNLCSPSATVTVKTRSSSSYTAELKDFDILNFQLVPGADLTALSPQTKCPGESATFTTKVSGEGALGMNVKWYKGTVSTATEITTGINYTDTTSTLTLSMVAVGDSGVYIAKLFNATCGEPIRSAKLTVNPTPTGTNTSQTLCPTSIGGTTANFNLTDKNSVVTGGVTGVSVLAWFGSYSSGSFSDSIASPSSYNASNGKIVYAKLSGVGGCIGVAADTLNVTSSPTGTNTSQTLCPTSIGGTTANFDLTDKNSVVTGGVTGVSVLAWFGSYSSGSFSDSIASPSSYNASNGKIVYAKLSGVGGCIGVAADTLYVTPSPTGTDTSMETCPSEPGGSTADFNLNSQNSVVTGGATGVSVSGWFKNYASGVFSDSIQSPASYTSPSDTVYARLTGVGGCFGVALNVLTVNPSAQGPNVVYNAPACYEAVFSVTITNPEVGAKYKIVDKNGINPDSVVFTAADSAAGDTTVVFTNRAAGSGYSVTATIGDCVSEATTCQEPEEITVAPTQQTIQGTKEMESKELTAYPVPFYDRVTIEFTVEKSGNYVINLYDMRGSLIKQLKSGTANAGEVNSVEVDGRSLPEGAYVARMVTETGAKSIKLLKNK